MFIRKLPVTLAISSALTMNVMAADLSHNFSQSKPLAGAEFKSTSGPIAKPFQLKKHQNEVGFTTFNWFSVTEDNSANLNFVASKKQQIQRAGNKYFESIANQHGYVNNGASQAVPMQVHDSGSGPVIMRYKQQVNGVDVIGSEINIVMSQELKAIASTGSFSSVYGRAETQATILNTSAIDAVVAAYKAEGINLSEPNLLSQGRQGEFEQFIVKSQPNFSEGKSWALGESAAKFVYYPTGKGVEPAYMINLSTVVANESRTETKGYIVSAQNLRVLHKGKLEADHAFRYRLYAEQQSPYKPFDTPTTIEVSPYPIGLDAESYGDYRDHIRDSNFVFIENAGLSTNDPWLPNGSPTAHGNNVVAMADMAAPEGYNPEKGDFYLPVSSAGTFDYQYNYNSPAADPNNVKGALTSMFYINNFLHDYFYDSGFDEKSGNAQTDNYGRGGLGDDAIHAHVDFNSSNNASMATPPDGQTPVMRMYTWGLFELGFQIYGLEETDGVNDEGMPYTNVNRFGRSVFGPTAFTIDDDIETPDIFENELVIGVDGSGDAGDFCEPAINGEEIKGRTVLIERGQCNFLVKAINAQKAGAVAYLVSNNTKAGEVNADGNEGGTVNMALGPNDDGSDIEIPGIFVSYEVAQPIYKAIANGDSITVDIKVETDQNHSAYDTGIVAHEWGHYLTNRLIHNSWGLMQWQGAAMGEGWSDFVALMVQLREQDRNILGNDNFQGNFPMSTFVGRNLVGNNSFEEGIRRYPYSTDMSVNGLTLGHIAFSAELPRNDLSEFQSADPIPNNEVHNAGEVWTAALWDVYIALHNERQDLSFDMIEQRMKEYLVASLKVTPYWPTFTEARDALLAVSAATDEQDFTIMLKAFARRGFGLDAIAPQRTDFLFDNVKEGFATQFPSFVVDNVSADYQYLGSSGAYCDIDESLDVDETMQIILHLKNLSNMPISGINAVISTISDATLMVDGVELINGRLPVSFADSQYGEIVAFPFEIKLNNAEDLSTVRLDISFESENSDANIPPTGSAWTTAQTDIVLHGTELDSFSDTIASEADWTTTAQDVSPAAYGNAVFPWVLDSGYGSEILTIRQGQMWWGAASQTRMLTTLESPEVEVNSQGEFIFEFFHIYEFEQAEYRFEDAPEDAPWTMEYWDGGVIEISVNDGAWQDVLTFNAEMSDPYDQIIHGTFPKEKAEAHNPLGHRWGYTGSLPGGEEVTITIPEGQLNGKRVKVRFAIGTDEQAPTAGWFIDDFKFTNIAQPAFSLAVAERHEACGNLIPMINTATNINVKERINGAQAIITLTATAFDYDGDKVTLTWQQLSGPSADLVNTSGESISFTAPIVLRNEQLTFEVTATDTSGDSRSVEIIVNLIDVNVAPTIEAADFTVKEGAVVTIEAITDDLDGDALLYDWVQSSGETMTFDGRKARKITFIAPNVDDIAQYSFTATVSDDSESAQAIYTLTVEPYKSNVSTGGSFGVLLSLMLTILAYRRRVAQAVLPTKQSK